MHPVWALAGSPCFDSSFELRKQFCLEVNFGAKKEILSVP